MGIYWIMLALLENILLLAGRHQDNLMLIKDDDNIILDSQILNKNYFERGITN